VKGNIHVVIAKVLVIILVVANLRVDQNNNLRLLLNKIYF